MRNILAIIFSVLSLSLLAQTNLVAYDYWFDSDYAGAARTSITPVSDYNLSASIPTTALSDGLHTFHLRFEDENGVFSSTVSSFFFKSELLSASSKTLTHYEYWIDSDHSSAVTTAMAGGANESINFPLDASGLTNGLHTIHFRFKDSGEEWSSTISKFFFKSEVTAANPVNEIVAYEYWFDSNHALATNTLVPAGQDISVLENIDATQLNNGLHTFNMRFKDAQGKWSGAISKFFFKSATTPLATNNIITYEYWYDSDHVSMVTVAVPSAADVQTIEALDATSLTNGLHIFHIRYQDEQGKWSGVKSDFFFKSNPSTSTTNNIVSYEYWYDSDYSSVASVALSAATNIQTIEALDATSLSNGLHVFHIRYLDEHGKSSSVKSKFFYHTETTSTSPALISAYRFWFDSDFANHTHEVIAPALADVNTIDLLDLTQIPHGQHLLHFQFKDDQGKWSSVTTDTIQKISLPIANFQASGTIICIGDQVVFDNTSIDGDTHTWNFGDTGSSSDSATMHIYNTPGIFDVSLTVTDTLTGIDSTMLLANFITVGDIADASLVLNNNDSICPGDAVSITAETGFTYEWNTLESTPSILVSNAGDYYVTIADVLNPTCITNSDTVTITINPEPLVDLGADVIQCDGLVFLDAENPGDVYLWNDNSGLQTLEATATGEYSVQVTNVFGCTSADTTFITIHPLPIVNLGADTIFGNPPETLDAGAGFAQYDWSTLESTSTIQVNADGEYWVTVTDVNGCSNSDTINVMFSIGIIEEIDIFFKAYPNPTLDRITIQTSEFKTGLTLHLVDQNGKLLMKEVLKTEVIEMDMSTLPAGTYYLVFELSGKGLTSIPIVKL